MKTRLQGAASTLLVAIVWEILGRASYRVAVLVSFPTRLVNYFDESWSRIFQDLLYTGAVTIVGFLLSAGVGGAVGAAAFRVPALRHFARRGLQLLQVVPVLVFAPFVTMLFGVGFAAHVTICFLVGLFPVTSLLLDALARVPESYFELVRLFRMDFRTALKHVYLPLAAPAAFAASRVAFSLCVVGATVAEFTGSRHGLGRNVFEAAVRVEPELLVLSTASIVIIGRIGLTGLSRLERRLVTWKA